MQTLPLHTSAQEDLFETWLRFSYGKELRMHQGLNGTGQGQRAAKGLGLTFGVVRVERDNEADERDIRSPGAERVGNEIRLAPVLAGGNAIARLVPIKHQLMVETLDDDDLVDHLRR